MCPVSYSFQVSTPEFDYLNLVWSLRVMYIQIKITYAQI